MLRLLVLLALVGAAVALLRTVLRPRRRADAAAPVRVLACEHCGVFVPDPDVVRADGHVYCSEAHRQAARVKRDA
ncbi:MAG: hypothetical protein IT495_18005 [Gammaproteobacteria bacterium]|nr:hypothetical protein [Gammaproteobacteria bacterium]